MNLSFCFINRDIKTSEWSAMRHCINADEVFSLNFMCFKLFSHYLSSYPWHLVKRLIFYDYYIGMHKIPAISISYKLYKFLHFFQYDLYCGTEIYTLLTTSLFFIGWAVGAVVLGIASDK